MRFRHFQELSPVLGPLCILSTYNSGDGEFTSPFFIHRSAMITAIPRLLRTNTSGVSSRKTLCKKRSVENTSLAPDLVHFNLGIKTRRSSITGFETEITIEFIREQLFLKSIILCVLAVVRHSEWNIGKAPYPIREIVLLRLTCVQQTDAAWTVLNRYL